MASKAEEKTYKSGVDAQGKTVDLSEFDENFYDSSEVDKIIGEYEKTFQTVEEGQIITGKILKITNKEVFIDVNFKSEGIVPISEFKDIDQYNVGDEVDVFLEQVEDEEGQLILSKSRADFLRVWDKIYDAYQNEEIVEGKLVKRIKGGIVVDLFSINAFLPGSQIDLRPITDMDAIIGETFQFRIIKVNKTRRNIVVSRRVILEEEREERRGTILEELEKGQIREGTVKNITDFGAFIDMDGVDGLLHITDMSWGRVNHPSEIVALGDRLKVKILDFNEDKHRISLGLKQLTEHPWKDVEEKFPEGSRVRGKIVSITDYGAFMELEKGIEGLIHISEMSWTQHIKHPSKIVGIGDIVEAVILKVDKENQKISLGFKQLEPDPWENIREEFPIGSVVTGKVRNIAAYGAFVELKEDIDGLIHISDMSWTKKINHTSEIANKGDTVKVKILDIDQEKRRISLGIKQLVEDPWGELAKKFSVGTEVECKVARILDRGLVVDLGDDVEGFVSINALGQKVKHPSDIYSAGDSLSAEVVEFDLEGRKILLSVEEYFKDKDEKEWKEYQEKHSVKQEEEEEAADEEEETHEEKAEEESAEKEQSNTEEKTEVKTEEAEEEKTEDKAEAAVTDEDPETNK